MLVQPLLQLAHQPDRDDDRNDMPLITDLPDRAYRPRAELQMPQQIPVIHLRVSRSEAPGIRQARIDHAQADDRAEENIAAEHACRRDCHYDRQICKGSRGNQIQEPVPVCRGKIRNRLAQRLDESHHQTRCHDCRKNRDEHVAERLNHPVPDRFLCRRGRLDLVLGRLGHAGDLQKLVIYLVDSSCSNDDLQLSVGLEDALDAVDILQFCLVHLAVVHRDQTETRRAVRGTDNILSSADDVTDFLGTLVIIQCHR